MDQRHPSWYGLYVRPGFENVVIASLSRKTLDLFLPTYTIRSRRKPDGQRVAPLFPNLVFCRAPARDASALLMTPGVVHILGTGVAGVKPIDECEIHAIKLAVEAGLPCQPCPFLEVGRRVRVCDGPLRDVEGILAESGNGSRIAIGISLLRRGVLVDLGRSTEVVAVANFKTSVPAKVS